MTRSTDRKEVMRIDEILPRTQGREVHTIAVSRPTTEVLTAAEQVTWAEVPKTAAVLRKKKLPDVTVLAELHREMGFRELESTADERVLGTIFKLPSGAAVVLDGSAGSALAAFEGFAKKGHVKVAFNFHHDGTVLTTKTLVQGTSRASGILFRLAWLGIRLPSGMTRKEWLGAIRRRLEPAGPA